ncbi:MAG: hypothetical protein QOI61_723 [Actinomycetota bacterium]
MRRARLLVKRYEPQAVLGVGGEAVVIRALDHQHGRVVALKIRSALNEIDRADALAEARTLLDLTVHRSVAVIRDDFFIGDDHVLVMEYVDGEDLARRLARDGAPGLPVEMVFRWLQEVASALDHIHGAAPAVVHGDIKPANIVVANEAPHTAVLVDFGQATGASPSQGTRAYSAPERGRESSPASDVFGLAATAQALLTGAPPEPGVEGDWSALPARQRRAVRSVLSRGLATDQARRPASAGAFVASLRQASD